MQYLWTVLLLSVGSGGVSGGKDSGPIVALTDIAHTCPACAMINRLGGPYTESLGRRIVVVGDIHGEAEGLREILFAAGVTSSVDSCEWKARVPDEPGLHLVQLGDIVDRGEESLAAYRCLNELQDTVPAGYQVTRLLGNHDIWWLSGQLHMRHPQHDSKEVVSEIVSDMKSRVLAGQIVGAHVVDVNSVPVTFIHGGLRPGMLENLDERIDKERQGSPKATTPRERSERIGAYINELTKEEVHKCAGPTWCHFQDEVFQAGPDRGGRNIGGPFWTDFHVLRDAADAASHSPSPPDMIQIVGHTVLAQIRYTTSMAAIGVDTGMVYGRRNFLELTPDGRFVAHHGNSRSSWTATDLSDEYCSKLAAVHA